MVTLLLRQTSLLWPVLLDCLIFPDSAPAAFRAPLADWGPLLYTLMAPLVARACPLTCLYPYWVVHPLRGPGLTGGGAGGVSCFGMNE